MPAAWWTLPATSNAWGCEMAASSSAGLRNYAIVTAAYWGFTLTDGALRMLVLFTFFKLGYSPFTLAFLQGPDEILRRVRGHVGHQYQRRG